MISKDVLDKAFDERFPLEIKTKLNDAKVAIAGIGGLGSNIAVMLARSGVGHLLLVDFDVVDVTNLNRQMYTINHIGMPKAEAIKAIIRDINPYLDIETLNTKVTSENASSIFSEYDIVCEAFDSPNNKAMLINTLLSENKHMTIVSGNGMAGYDDTNKIQTRKDFSRLYTCGDLVSGVENGLGLMAPRVAVCAGHQANKVIQLILNDIE